MICGHGFGATLRFVPDTVAATDISPPGPPLPLGRRVDLPGRGVTFAREIPAAPGKPTLLLLHGWMASGGLNWLQAFDDLEAAGYGVVAPDLRGHGRGIRHHGPFRLADCADDTAALLDQLDVGPVVTVGYSMGGPVSLLLWHRRPDLVTGVVFIATAARFVHGGRERMVFASTMAATAGVTRAGQWAARQLRGRNVDAADVTAPPGTNGRAANIQAWAAAEMRRHDPRVLLEAGHAIGRIDLEGTVAELARAEPRPAVSVITTRDRAVDVDAQRRLAELTAADTVDVDAGHVVCARSDFGRVVVDAAGRIRLPDPADPHR